MTTTTTARARRSDPSTSHAAAASVLDITATQEWVIRALRRPTNDVELLARYRNFKKAPKASDSGIRSRRAELVERGAVQDTGERVTLDSGRRAIVWQLNPEHYIVKAVMGA